MQFSNNDSIKNIFRSNDKIEARARLLIEWNHNRYNAVKRLDNTPKNIDDSYDGLYFPLRSIVGPQRPQKSGLAKARVMGGGPPGGKWNKDDNVQDRNNGGFVRRGYSGNTEQPRYYLAGEYDKYKYWSSPTESSFSGDGGNWRFKRDGTNVKPYIVYDKPVNCNKIVIVIENSWVVPTDWKIQVTSSDSKSQDDDDNDNDWTTIASNITVATSLNSDGPNSDGNVTLWLQDDGSWSQTRPRLNYQHFSDDNDDSRNSEGYDDSYDATDFDDDSHDDDQTPNNFVQLQGLRLVVNEINRKDACFDLIEMSLRLEQNVTPWLLDYNVTNSMSETSHIAPFGVSSSNEATVNLSNIISHDDIGLFNPKNTSSPYYGLMDANAKFTLDLMVKDGSGSSYTPIRQFTMWSDGWDTTYDIATIPLKDSSKFLQNEEVPEALFYDYRIEGKHHTISPGEIIWRIMDMLGYNNWEYHRDDDDDRDGLEFFWTDGETMAWEVFSNLARVCQMAVYFDEHDVLQILTKRDAYRRKRHRSDDDWRDNRDTMWLLTARDTSWNDDNNNHDDDEYDDSGNVTHHHDDSDPTHNFYKQNIEDMTPTNAFEANKVKISYEELYISNDNNGFPKMEVVWQADDPTVLRSTMLTRTLDKNDMVIRIDDKNARVWPYEGLVNIEGEIIRYSGKGYIYYDKSGAKQFRYINSQNEYDRIYNDTPKSKKHMNHFTGGLKVTERGEWWTEPKKHTLDALQDYSVNHKKFSKPPLKKHGGRKHVRHVKHDSLIRVHNTKKYTRDDIITVSRGRANDQAYKYMGTRMRFAKGDQKHNCAGIVFNMAGGTSAGYYVQITSSDSVNKNKWRESNPELVLYSKDKGVQNKLKRLEKQQLSIAEDSWIDLEVYIEYLNDGKHHITILVNGKIAMIHDVDKATRVPKSGQFGLFSRGHTNVDFEYIFGTSRDELDYNLDQADYWDRKNGGFQSLQKDREFSYNFHHVIPGKHKHRSKKWKKRFRQLLIDDFGPYVHEVREFDVKFDPFPVIYSNFYSSNDWQAACLQYNANAFRANFVIANASRYNAVIQGGDNLSFDGEEVGQQTAIFGRAIYKKDTSTITVKDDDAIRARGIIETEFSSEWIQNKAHAQSIGDFIKDHWAKICDEIAVTEYGNPLHQLGDRVAVYHPELHFRTAADEFVIVGITHNWEPGGITTTLTCRRMHF